MTKLTWIDEPRPLACKVCRQAGDGTAIAIVHAKSGQEIVAIRCPHCGSIDLVDDPQDGMPLDARVDDYIEVGAGLSTIASAFTGIDPSSVSRFLDVGCGYGFALDVARFAYGWTGVGVEPSLAGRRGAAELGLDIRAEYLTADTDLGEPFDLILASEVVEHVIDPLTFLTALRAHLAVGGTLIVTTPAAEVVSPVSPEPDVLCAVSPTFHTFVATEGALDQLLRTAGFSEVAVTRNGGSLRATARRSPATVSPAHISGADVESYLRERMANAPVDSALSVGMSVRLIRILVAEGRLDEADNVARTVRAAFSARHGVDLNDPGALLAQADDSQHLPWSAAGACFALGSLDLHLHGNPQRAADYFALTSKLAEFWPEELDFVDLDLVDLRFQGAYNRAFAQTRFSPSEAAMGAVTLISHLSPSQANRHEVDVAGKCRIFVELVAQGYRSDFDLLQQHVQVVAQPAARSDVPEVRVAGLDALYSLGVVHRDAGDEKAAQAAFVQCISICEGRPMDDEHAARLAELCRANLPQPKPREISTTKTGWRLFRRERRRSGRPVKWFVDTYWTDTWGTYLDGWVRVGDARIRSVSVESNRMSVAADLTSRPDGNTGFSVYLPGRVSFPVTLALTTDEGDATAEVDLPARPRPVHPQTPSAIPDPRLRKAMDQAPPGPALALGVRSLNEELAQVRNIIIGEREILGLDIHAGFGVDVVGDVHQLSALFPPNHFSVIYSAALLEHVQAPWLVAAECAKVLKPGGVAVHVAPWVWPTHSEPNDFWRFSDRGLASLFHESLGFRIVGCGGSGGAIITPTPDWRHEQIRFPTYSSPAMSWVIAEKVADPQPVVWPYTDADVATAQEYPLDGLSDETRVAP